ncbi:hypothetical protein CHU92_14295 [Flavobacterium cyanobacteriorum]|uniref:Uncharacterized protein n=1 Tax=Flavobacterium cyanobacteriorum TaxID=2022802 RepID=A0A255YSQ9_9FLAO|nr:hypothetical protein [Flavobacterium cyanobacteriorum]OYQ32252.1 hypothetical protein CHU92_14295 [Flavobacterium cyanobacteriorum]
MKKIWAILFLVISAGLAAQSQNEWEEWQKTSCYSKIWFRLREEPRHGEQYHWKVQFRNGYNELISFNYHVADKLQQYNITTRRKTLNAGQESEEIDIYAREADIYLLVDKVSLSPYPESFLGCDQ